MSHSGLESRAGVVALLPEIHIPHIPTSSHVAPTQDHGTTRQSCWISSYKFLDLSSIGSTAVSLGTLAEWLTRWPASPSQESQPVPSGACVRITQVSHQPSFLHILVDRE